MTQPLVSIVLPTWRSSQYLMETLRSVQLQTLSEWELLVVDDGAPDQGWLEAQLAGIGHSRIVRQPHLGVAAARNAGCLAASGAFVTFVDDDDYWPENRLAVQLAALEEAGDAVCCYGQLVHVDASGVEFGDGPYPPSELARLPTGFCIGTTMVRRDMLPRSGWFNPLLPCAEDIDFSLRLTDAGPVVYIPQVLLYYRRHESNATGRATVARRYSRAVYEHHYRLANLRSDRQTMRALASTSRANEIYFAKAALRAARRGLAKRDLAAALREAADAGVSATVALRATWRSFLARAGRLVAEAP
jgi:glycosyltransferase involved in cell wall biosynthesis